MNTTKDALRIADELDAESVTGRVSNHTARKAAQTMRLLVDSREANEWCELFWQVAKELNCLPSTFVDANAHVIRKAKELAQAKSEPAASGESLIQILHDPENQPSQYGTVPMDWVPPGFWLAPDEPSEAMCKAAVIDFNGPAVYKSVAMEALAIEEGIYGDMYKAMRVAHLAAIAATQGGGTKA